MLISIARIRDAFTVGLGIVSMVALAIATIGHFEKKALYAELGVIGGELDTVVSINAKQQETIDFLFSQREIDEKLLAELDGSFARLAETSEEAKRALEDLKREDSDFEGILSKRHPVDVNRLLNSIGTKGSDRDSGDKAPATN